MLLVLVFAPAKTIAGADWASLTWDNDIFLGKDNGYTNGWYASWFETDMEEHKAVNPSFLVSPLLWSMSDGGEPLFKINTHTIGQAMVTPRDITRENPNRDDLPYSGLFFYTNAHFHVHDQYADKVSTTVGIIGPASGAERTQKFVHRALDADRPRGWDYQLENELVFRISRSRIWRLWASGNGSGKTDVLVSAEGNLGTLESSLGGGLMWRYGRGLAETYVTPAFHSSRSSNPLSIDGGWYVYLGVSARYLANYIFVDGNTFTDSRSAELDHSQFGVTTGITYSWRNVSMTFAVEDMNVLEDRLEGTDRFGSLTLAWRLD